MRQALQELAAYLLAAQAAAEAAVAAVALHTQDITNSCDLSTYAGTRSTKDSTASVLKLPCKALLDAHGGWYKLLFSCRRGKHTVQCMLRKQLAQSRVELRV